MLTYPTKSDDQAPSSCSKCLRELTPGSEYRHRSKVYCEDCCMDIRMSRVRKTHWQYLTSIKAKSLIPGKNA